MKPTEINGIRCECKAVFKRFSTWESHRTECDHYE